MDAITLLRNDHRTVEGLFKDFERAGDGALEEKRRIVDRIVEELSVHAAIEEQVLYPVARATVSGAEDTVLESLEEHHIVKWTLSELAKLEPTEERFDAKVTVLMESVRHHVKEEEGELFPKLRQQLGRRALEDLGEELQTAKQIAPTSPHPRWPDEPPAAGGGGGLSGVVNRVEENIAGMAQGGMRMVQDLIDRIRSVAKPSPAKKTATKRSPAKKAAAKKSAAKKATARTATALKKAATAKTPAKKTSARKTPAKKTAANKAAARTTSSARPAARKRASTRPATRTRSGSRSTVGTR